MTDARARHLISPGELRHSPPTELVLLDARVGDFGRADPTAYLTGHIPNARFVDIDTDLAGVPTTVSGARPLPDVDVVSAALRRWGIDDTSSVVVYDDSRSTAAGRAWWVLRWAGLHDVRVLDGGLGGWVTAGGSIHSGPAEAVTAGTSVATPGHLDVVTTEQVSAVDHVLDARPPDRYAGPEGRIPGALSAPVFDDLDSAGFVLDDATLRERYRVLDVHTGTVAAYCGSAVAAALQVLVLATIGIDAALYVGSFSQWTADPNRPVDRTPVAEPV